MTPDQPSDPPVQRLETAIGTIAYRDEGSGTPVVTVHGLPGSGRDFRWLAPLLGQYARLVRVDMPGFGDSPGPVSRQTSIPQRAAAVMAVADALGLERFVVLGHSIGGPVALEVAARNPSRICGLALLASVGLRPHRLLRQSNLRPVGWALRLPWASRLLEQRLRAAFTDSGFPETTPMREIERSIHCAMALDFTRIRANSLLLRAPALVSWAADDTLVEDAIGIELSAACGAGMRLRFDEGGHNIQKSKAVEIVAALRSWLQDVVEPACA